MIQLLLAAMLVTGGQTAQIPQAAQRFVTTVLHVTRYRAAAVDLNGDGVAELLIYAEGPGHCGSGGCDLYVLTPRRGSFTVISSVSVVRTPIWVLNTATHGWRDLSVMVAGGGIRRGYQARLRFDGRHYPGNPTVAPASRVKDAGGRVVIE